MVTPLMKLLIAIVLMYLLLTLFLKFTKMIMRVVIVVLIIGIFVLGYQSIGEMWSKPAAEDLKDIWVEKAEPANITVENNTTDDLSAMDRDLAELEDLEKELDISSLDINSTEVDETI